MLPHPPAYSWKKLTEHTEHGDSSDSSDSNDSSESTESGESGESPESTVFDNLWSIHGNLCFPTYNP